MTRERAEAAIEASFDDGIKKLFGVLVQNLTAEAGHDEAVKRFSAGVGILDEAHSKAIVAVERIFPE